MKQRQLALVFSACCLVFLAPSFYLSDCFHFSWHTLGRLEIGHAKLAMLCSPNLPFQLFPHTPLLLICLFNFATHQQIAPLKCLTVYVL